MVALSNTLTLGVGKDIIWPTVEVSMAFFNLTQLGPQNFFQTARSSENHPDAAVQKESTPVKEAGMKVPTDHCMPACDVAGKSSEATQYPSTSK